MLRTCIFLFLLHLSVCHKVGILLNTESPISASVNNISNYFTTSSSPLFTLVTQHHDTSYPSILQAVCNLLQQNVSVIISADEPSITRTQLNIISQYGIPLISAVTSSPFFSPNASLIRLIPSDVSQSQAVFALLKEYNWTEFSILGSADDYGTATVMELQFLAAQDNNFMIRNVQYFDVDVGLKGEELVWFERELVLIKKSLVRVIVLNCAGQFTKKIFREAKLHGLLEDSYVWIVMNGATAAEIQISSLVDPTISQLYNGVLGTVPDYGPGAPELMTVIENYVISGGNRSDFNAVSIMVYKGLNVTDTALRDLVKKGWSSEPSVKCCESNVWSDGSELQDKIKEVVSKQGPRTFDILNFWNSWKEVGRWQEGKGLTDDEGQKVRWTTRKDISFIGGEVTAPKGMGNLLTGHHLRIATIPEAPLSMLNSKCIHKITSPKCWTGLNAEIIERLSTDLNFTYEFYMPSDVQYGDYNDTTRTWNGMVQLIVNSSVNMTTGLITSPNRSRFVTFTTSFFNDEASMVYFLTDSHKHKQTFDLFFFMKPFHSSVWFVLMGLVGVMAAVLSCLSKFSPLSSFGRRVWAMQKCTCKDCQQRMARRKEHKVQFRKTAQFGCLLEKEEDGALEDLLLKQSAWIIGTGLVQHDAEWQPQSPSGRFLIFTWWFFIMIITSIYTANLTAFLTLSQASSNIKTMLDLVHQDKYTWGLIKERDLQLAMTQNPSYKELVENANLSNNFAEAVERVKKGGFVLIAEGSAIRYALNTNCKAHIIKTGKFLNSWAFAMQMNSPYQSVINERLLQYRTEDWLNNMEEKWYRDHERSCVAANLGANNTEFTVPLLTGLFIILALGVLVSFIWLAVEVVVTAHRDSGDEGFGATLRKWVSGATKEIACGRNCSNACGGNRARVGDSECEKVEVQ